MWPEHSDRSPRHAGRLEAAEAAALRVGLMLGHAAIVFLFLASQDGRIDTGRKVRSHLHQLEAQVPCAFTQAV